jgi:hypothetical protein
MKNKIGMIGMGDIGMGKVAAKTLKKDNDLILLEQDESFVLNGVKYAPIKTEQRKHKHVSSKLGGFIEKVSMIYMPYMDDLYWYGESRYKRKLPEGTDIIKEYGLIQNKQSTLSRWERDMVTTIFKRNYKVQDEKVKI